MTIQSTNFKHFHFKQDWLVQGKESQEAEENEEVMDANNEEEQVQEENVRLPSVPISDGGCVSVFISTFSL